MPRLYRRIRSIDCIKGEGFERVAAFRLLNASNIQVSLCFQGKRLGFPPSWELIDVFFIRARHWLFRDTSVIFFQDL